MPAPTPSPSPHPPSPPGVVSHLGPAVGMLLMLTLLTGVAYPLAITLIARIAFPSASRGSLVMEGGKATMSRILGQPFKDPKYFWSRPSATLASPYDAQNSAGSNLGPTNPDLHNRIAARIAALRAVDPGNTAPIPVDLVTASASGLDPHISPAAAQYQLARVARVRGLSEERLRELVRTHTEGRDLGVLGEPRVNVGMLNRALDRLDRTK